MNYFIDAKKTQKRIFELGYSSLADFASKAGIHRNTVQNLLKGQSIFSRAFEAVSKALRMDPLDLVSPQSDFPSKTTVIDEIRSIVAALVRKDRELAVVLIGSRAAQNTKKAKRYSDWDLGIVRYPRPLSGLEYLRLKNQVEEMSENLVRSVDLVNLNQAPAWFLEGLSGGVVFLDGNQEALTYLKGLTDGIQKEKAA